MDLNDLQKFLKICRKQGVSKIAIEGINIDFAEIKKTSDAPSDDGDVPDDPVNDVPSDEEIMYYSSNASAVLGDFG
jgi:hypothetical protein